MAASGAEAIAMSVLASCDEIERHVRGVVAGAPPIIDEILDHVRVGWPISVPLPGFVKDQIRDLIMRALREVADRIYEALDIFRMIARQVGRPSVLRAAAAILDAKVVSASNVLDSEMQSSALRALDVASWDSDATPSYSGAFTDQARTVGGISEPALGLQHLLEEMADSIDQFFDDFLTAFIGFGIAVAGLVIAAATVELIVVPIVALIIAIAGFIWGLWSLYQVFEVTASRNAEIAQRVVDSEALDWPESAFAQ